MRPQLVPGPARNPDRCSLEDGLIEDDAVAQGRLLDQGPFASDDQRLVLTDEAATGVVDPDLPGRAQLRRRGEARVDLRRKAVAGQYRAGTGAMQVPATQIAADADREIEAVALLERIRGTSVRRHADELLETHRIHRIAAGRDQHVAATELESATVRRRAHAFDGALRPGDQTGDARAELHGDAAARDLGSELAT